MIAINTLSKIKTLVLSVCILFSVGLFAQSEKTSGNSTIVMTKAELSSFLNTIAEARRSQLKERETRLLQTDLAELRLKYQQRSGMGRSGTESVSNQDILRELRYVNQRVDQMSATQNQYPSMNRDNSTIIMPSNAAQNPSYNPNRNTSTTIAHSNKRQIAALQSKIDSLKNAEASNTKFRNDASFGDSLNVVNNRLTEVRRQMEQLESKLNASNNKNKPSKPARDKSYFKQQVYFDNNSESLRDEYFKYVQDLTQLLLEYPEAKVMLEGWASPVGKADYNKRLSMRRSESVEKAFVNNGIDSSRILTSFRGEDKISSEQHARRVDMSIIVR
jgi:outer membrane protein OmpA-like peptidoglycan-associated protein